MKTATALLVVAGFFAVAHAEIFCKSIPSGITDKWIEMEKGCIEEMRRQIGNEITASMQYLAMGAHFSRDTVNRPGFAKLFFEAATEERQHAMKLIEYLLMRGELTEYMEIRDLIRSIPLGNVTLDGVDITLESIETGVGVDPSKSTGAGVLALERALQLEAAVTRSIKQVIIKCENSNQVNDYHLVDYLTGEFLEEQYKGQRDLAGKASTLKKMMNTHKDLGEFLFDKKILNGELLSH